MGEKESHGWVYWVKKKKKDRIREIKPRALLGG